MQKMNAIANWRKNFGYDLHEAANILGVTARTVSRWEKALELPQYLVLLCRYMNAEKKTDQVQHAPHIRNDFYEEYAQRVRDRLKRDRVS